MEREGCTTSRIFNLYTPAFAAFPEAGSCKHLSSYVQNPDQITSLESVFDDPNDAYVSGPCLIQHNKLTGRSVQQRAQQ
jgi:hypothetical protein